MPEIDTKNRLYQMYMQALALKRLATEPTGVMGPTSTINPEMSFDSRIQGLPPWMRDKAIMEMIKQQMAYKRLYGGDPNARMNSAADAMWGTGMTGNDNFVGPVQPAPWQMR